MSFRIARWFCEIGIGDVPSVGGKIASLGEMYRELRPLIGICGQAPSDYPEFARFLVEQGIDSISLNPDVVVKTTLDIVRLEKL